MFLALLAAALAIAGVLNIMSYETLSSDIFVSSQKLEINRTVEKINFASRLGKPIEHFYGASELLKEVGEGSDYITSARIYDLNGSLLYIFPEEERPKEYKITQGDSYVKSNGIFYVELPMEGGNTFGIVLDGKEIGNRVSEYAAIVFRIFIAVLILSAAAAALLLFVFKFKIRAVAVTLVVSQLAFGALNSLFYYDVYIDSVNEAILIFDKVISRDIRQLESAGISRSEFYQFDEYLGEIADSADIFSAITAEGNQDSIELPDSGIYMTLNHKIINDKIFSYLLDALILSAVTFFLSIEIMFFISKKKPKENKENKANKKDKKDKKSGEMSVSSFRLTFFSLYFALNVCAAFCAVIAYRLSIGGQYGEYSEFLAGIPASAELLAVIAAILTSGGIIRRLGIEKSLVLSAALGAVSLFASAFSNNLFLFSICRIVMGFTFGLLTIAGRVVASAQTDEKLRSEVLTALNAGMLVGCCCGTVIGGTLADGSSFKLVFIIGAALTGLCIPLIKRCGLKELEEKESINVFGFLKRIFTEKSLLIHLSALVLPCFGAGVFISYSVPFFGAKNNLPINLISALIMLNSLLAAYLSPLMVRISAKISIRKKSAFYGFMTGGALIIFCLTRNIFGLIISIILLGVADSFGVIALIDGMVELPAFKKLGSSYSMISFTLFGKAGQFIALQTFAVTGGFPVILALSSAAGAIIYIAASKNKEIN